MFQFNLYYLSHESRVYCEQMLHLLTSHSWKELTLLSSKRNILSVLNLTILRCSRSGAECRLTVNEDEMSEVLRLAAVDPLLVASNCSRCVAQSTLASRPACHLTSPPVVVGRPSLLASTSVCRRQHTTDRGSSSDQISWSPSDASTNRPTGRERLQRKRPLLGAKLDQTRRIKYNTYVKIRT